MDLTDDVTFRLRAELNGAGHQVPEELLAGVAALSVADPFDVWLVRTVEGEWRFLGVTDRSLVYVMVAASSTGSPGVVTGWVRRLADVSCIGIVSLVAGTVSAETGPDWWATWEIVFSDGFGLRLPLFHAEEPASRGDERTETLVRIVRHWLV